MPSSSRYPAGRRDIGLQPKAIEALHAGVNLLSVTVGVIVVAFFMGCDSRTGWEPAPFDYTPEAYDYAIDTLELGIAFPPNGNQVQRAFTTQQLAVLSIDRMRIAQRWSLREPERDDFNWAPLESRMDDFSAAGLELFITLEMKGMPDWLAGLGEAERANAFRAYAAALLSRYGGDIAFIQFGNEWNWEIDAYFDGNDDEFVRFANVLYDEVMKLPAHARPTVVLGSVAIGGLRGLAIAQGRLSNVYFDGTPLYTEEELNEAHAAMLKALPRYQRIVDGVRFEAVDLHLYDDFWNWEVYRDSFAALLSEAGKDLADYRILASEFGGPHPDIEPSEEGYKADRLVSYVQTLDDIGIEHAYYFKLVEEPGSGIAHPNSFLIDRNLELTPAFEVMKRFGKQ
jgi:hypothetical protein